jgi:hypothetical protein
MIGKIISSNGYIKLLKPKHPNADSKGYVYEHRIVAERKLGRPLNTKDIVHHIDGNKQNNRPKNLVIVDGHAEHQLYHRKNKNRRKPGELNQLILCACGCGKTFYKYDSTGRPRRFISGHNGYIPRRLCACGCGEYVKSVKSKFKINHWSKRRLLGFKQESISCACGCGTKLFKYDKYWRKRKYISGHNARKSS